jgi:hypothetical protein
LSKELDFELGDILEEITFDNNGIAKNDEKVIEENIIYILKREKLWKKNYTICFPVGATSYLDVGEGVDDPSSYEYGFEIFSDLNTVVASGSVSGCLMAFRERSKDGEEIEDGEVVSVEVVDMNMSLTEYSNRFLTKTTDKEVVAFT